MTDLNTRRLAGVAAILVVGCLVAFASFGNLGQNLVYYWSPTELAAKGVEAQAQTVRLGGLVKPGSFELKACNPGCDFVVTDGAHDVKVHSEGQPPQMFRQGIGVVLEGQLHGDTFQAERVMVKHSNEYRAPTDKTDVAAAAKTLEE
jgi:cytochrome c-type biogenesis protein CcmE